VLVADLKTSSATPDGDGRFTVTVPAASRYRASFSVNFALPDRQHYKREWTAAETGDLVMEFQVP
jgi:hypothetical protein